MSLNSLLFLMAAITMIGGKIIIEVTKIIAAKKLSKEGGEWSERAEKIENVGVNIGISLILIGLMIVLGLLLSELI